MEPGKEGEGGYSKKKDYGCVQKVWEEVRKDEGVVQKKKEEEGEMEGEEEG